MYAGELGVRAVIGAGTHRIETRVLLPVAASASLSGHSCSYIASIVDNHSAIYCDVEFWDAPCVHDIVNASAPYAYAPASTPPCALRYENTRMGTVVQQNLTVGNVCFIFFVTLIVMSLFIGHRVRCSE